LLIKFLYLIILVIAAVLISQPGRLDAEFYEYVDDNDVKNFTDDESLIPAGQTQKAKVHKEKYDHLKEEQRQRLIQKEEQEIEQINQRIRKDLETYRKKEALEKQKQEEMARQKRLAALKTPVEIRANKILVPVTINYAGQQTTVTLLLDTGASITTVNQFVAEQLNITGGEKSAAVVAGGGILRTKRVSVQKISVGPKSISPHQIMVFEELKASRGYQGLLGQDFLKQFRYTIDYAEEIIHWLE
jgi:predicted aspartyl protease